ncbi:MAG: hypothetical protein LC687_01890, partial [Actinobacteria bacterium]|nr:hypothetical protein [Actinomycetota bacterium]
NMNTPLGQPSKSHQYGVAVDLLANGEVCAGAWVGSGCTQSSYSNEATITLGKLFVDTGMVKNIWWCPPDATAHRASGGISQNELRNHADSVGQPININCQWQNRDSNGHADHFHIDLLDEVRVHDDQRYSSPSSGLFVN